MGEAEGPASSGADAVIRLGVHIRRGDYATWQGGRYLYTDEQYLNIIRQAMTLNADRRAMVYICGNDPQLNRQLYVDTLGADRVCFPDGNPGEEDASEHHQGTAAENGLRYGCKNGSNRRENASDYHDEGPCGDYRTVDYTAHRG